MLGYILTKTVGIDIPEVHFISCQAFAIICSVLLRKYLPPTPINTKKRHICEFIIGAFLLLYGYGRATIHMLFQAVPAYIIMRICPLAYAQYFVLIFSMVYLSGVHLSQTLYGSIDALDITSPLMVQTQKLSSLVFNMNDGATLEQGLSVPRECHKVNAVRRRPKLLELGGFLFCFHNVMAGPFMFFADYMRFINGNEVDRLSKDEDKQIVNEHIEEIRDARAEIRQQWKLLACHIPLSLFAYTYFKVSYMYSNDFAKSNVLAKYIWITATGFFLRQKFYVAWSLSCICNLSAGFGFSGFSPDGQPEYAFAKNIYFTSIEFGTSMKTIIDAWNTATTRWLRQCIYDRVPSQYAVWSVFLASALWHGFYPGYYLAFLSAALFTIVGRMCRRYLRPTFTTNRNLHKFYDIVTHLSALFCLNYLGIAFSLKHTRLVLTFWRQVLFLGHLIPLALMFLLSIVPPATKRDQGRRLSMSSSPRIHSSERNDFVVPTNNSSPLLNGTTDLISKQHTI